MVWRSWLKRLFGIGSEDEGSVDEDARLNNDELYAVALSSVKCTRVGPEFCFCGVKVNAFSGKHCKYCGAPVCNDHITASKHDCSGNPSNPHRHAGVQRGGYIYGK